MEIRGTGVSPGRGAGPVRKVTGAIPQPRPGRHDGDPAVERDRADMALTAVAGDLTERADRAAAAGRPDAADVLRAQALMAADPGLRRDVLDRVDAGISAARAVHEAFGVHRAVLAAGGGYLAARIADLDDVCDRAVARLLGVPMPGVPESDEPFVLVARDLAPADTAMLDPERVIAFVTEEGGPTSHTAILARSLGVPAVVACPGCTDLADGVTVLVDGGDGSVIIDPPAERVDRARAAASAAVSTAEAIAPGATADGLPVPLLANIGGRRDLAAAVRNGAEGVGLYRTEMLFLDRADEPSVAEQQAAYREVLAAFPAGPVTVRVLDAGSDKPLAFVPPPATEPNPALGERGLRLLSRHPDVLDRQLAALAAAAAGLTSSLRVMAPMVTDAAEAREFTHRCAAAGIDTAGIMIEVPAAALRAGDLIAETGFFSLGTNDLTQYVCAADRQLGSLGRLQDPWHPAVLDLVALAAAAAAEAAKGCGVCGEAAADPALACVLVGLGVTSLSMGAAALPLVRSALAAHTHDQCAAAAAAARGAASAAAARDAARSLLPELARLGL